MHTFDGGSLAELALGKRNIIMQFSAKIFSPLKREEKMRSNPISQGVSIFEIKNILLL